MGLNEQYFERWAEKEAKKRASDGWSNLPWIHFFSLLLSPWWWNWGTKAFAFSEAPKMCPKYNTGYIYFFAKVFSPLVFFDYPLRSRIFSILSLSPSIFGHLLRDSSSPQTSHTYLTLDSILTNDFFFPQKTSYGRSQEVIPTVPYKVQ